MDRPDLSRVEPEIAAYIESLEARLEQLESKRGVRGGRARDELEAEFELPLEPDEPPTTWSLITLSAAGCAKRTPRHLYSRQRRGGMGIFDLDVPEADPPAFLAIADEGQDLILLTNLARAFRLPVDSLPLLPVRGRGESITARLPLGAEERLAAVLPRQDSGYVALLSQSGAVRCLRHHYFGESLDSEVSLYNLNTFGPLAAACWTAGNADLFIATRQGRAIRFSEKQVSVQGSPGIRLDKGDRAVAVAPVRQDSAVFLLSAGGKGTIRLMAGFAPNKSPGAGGKVAINTDQLVGAVSVQDDDDLFIISRLSKIIRFKAGEVPAKEGVVQGVHCMALRADETVATASSPKA
ncbi:MAG: hypothetical protein JW850_01845 [Thermoflexales bacterium]|nr:hypothetical protein [Thermoflexales bacterium]